MTTQEADDLPQARGSHPLSVSVPLLPPLPTRSLQPASSKGVGILVMGLTGAGKSTFISQITHQQLNIGHSLESCTDTVYGYHYLHTNGQEVWLIDTPGFDDTSKSNAQVLGEIASFLCTFCNNHNLVIGGLLYVHRINDIRMSNSSLRSLRIFEALCGESSFRDVTIVTTMWDALRSQEALQAAVRRETTLQSRHDFFGRLMQGGARYERHKDSRTSSIDIIEKIVNQNRRVILAVQEELERNPATTLMDTTVGKYLEGDLRGMRKKYETKIAQLQAYNDDSGEIDDDLASMVQTEKDLVLNIQSDIDFLHLTFETLRKERGTRMIEEGRTAKIGVEDSALLDDQTWERGTKEMTQTNGQYFSTPRTSTEIQTNDTRVQCSPDHTKSTTREKRSKPKRASTWEDFLRATLVPSQDHGKAMFHTVPRSRSEDRGPGNNHLKMSLQQQDKRAHSKPKETQHSAPTAMPQGWKVAEQLCADQTIPVECEHQQRLETWQGPQQTISGEIRSSSPEVFMSQNGLRNLIIWDNSGLKRSYTENSNTGGTHALQYRTGTN